MKMVKEDVKRERGTLLDKSKIGFRHEQQEVFGCIAYDENNKIIGLNKLFQGRIDSTVADPRIIFREVLRQSELKGFMIFHNHPSGNPIPSREDISLTNRIGEIAEQLEIEFTDHLIIGKERVLSFVDEVNRDAFNNNEYIKMIVSEDIEKYGDFDMKGTSIKTDSLLDNSENMKDEIIKLMEYDYKGFIKGLISIEKDINDIVSDDIIREDLPSKNDRREIAKDKISTKSLLRELKSIKTVIVRILPFIRKIRILIDNIFDY